MLKTAEIFRKTKLTKAPKIKKKYHSNSLQIVFQYFGIYVWSTVNFTWALVF